jgi:hypothetical protein
MALGERGGHKSIMGKYSLVRNSGQNQQVEGPVTTLQKDSLSRFIAIGASFGAGFAIMAVFIGGGLLWYLAEKEKRGQ